MKEWHFETGETALLDDEDYERIPQSGWYVTNRTGKGNSKTPYVQHDKYGKLHRYILNVDNPNVIVDHLDRNGLNNQKSNLRLTNCSINKRNADAYVRNEFNFSGITAERIDGKITRIRAAWNEEKNARKSKSFSIKKYGLSEAIRLAILTRIEKMRQFEYIIDERSETIEKSCLEPNADIESILGIDFEDLVE